MIPERNNALKLQQPDTQPKNCINNMSHNSGTVRLDGCSNSDICLFIQYVIHLSENQLYCTEGSNGLC